MRTWAELAVTTAILTCAATARADGETQQCATAAEQGQALRDEGKYRRAREQFLTCSRDVCPGPIRKDCAEWLAQNDVLAPTVVLTAREGDKDVMDVRVQLDGALLTERLDGRPVPVDTGEHVFRFERAGTFKEERVLVSAGQKGRSISVTFAAREKGAAPDVKGPGVSTDDRGSSMVPVYILGGVGVLGIAGFTFFGLSGNADVSDLQSCKPRCSESDVDKARTKLLVADISLGVGVVSLGVAAYLYFMRPKEAASASVRSGARPDTQRPLGASAFQLDAGPLPGGAGARVQGRF